MHRLATMYNVGDATYQELDLIERITDNMGVERTQEMILVAVQVYRSLKTMSKDGENDSFIKGYFKL